MCRLHLASKNSLFLSLLLLLSCVSSGKFKRLQAEAEERKVLHRQEVERMEKENKKLSESEQLLRDEMIKQNTLLSSLLADKINLENEISDLQSTINQLTNESASAQAILNQELQSKNNALQVKEQILNTLLDKYKEQQKTLGEISSDLADAYADYSDQEVEWYLVDQQLRLVYYDDLLFGDRSNLSTRGISSLEALNPVVSDHPSLIVVVEGHTDNSVPAERALANSLTSATTVVNFLLDQESFNANQIQVAGKGSFAPRMSNQTPAGRALNNRIEIGLSLSQKEFFEIIRQQN